MSWEPVKHGYRNGDYEARPVGDVWRLFHHDHFIFSSASPAAIHRFVAARRTLEIRGETLRQLADDEPGTEPDREARGEESGDA